MSNYSYSEIQKMQKRAMERVREMQKKSDEAVGNNSREYYEPKPAPKSSEKSGSQSTVKPKITNLPPNFPDFKEYFTERSVPVYSQKEEENTQHFQGNIADIISQDPDRALLMGLLLLLKSEGADEMLMMALMYIIA